MDWKKRDKKIQWHVLVEELKDSELPDLEKVLMVYDFTVEEHIEHSSREIELARAMKDSESVVREQIKMETLKFSQKRLRELQMIFTRSEP